jgi:hypothetical protein
VVQTIKELVAEYTQYRQEQATTNRNSVLLATGRYHLGEITEEHYNELVMRAHSHHADRLRCKLKEIAQKIEDPLATWCTNNLPTHTALYVIKRLPLSAEEMDALAIKTNWCVDVYQTHRDNAIKSGALFERKDK